MRTTSGHCWIDVIGAENAISRRGRVSSGGGGAVGSLSKSKCGQLPFVFAFAAAAFSMSAAAAAGLLCFSCGPECGVR